MSRPAYLPALPRVETVAPPDGFAAAIRAAGRRRRRRAGTALGGGLAALLLALPAGGQGGTAGLEPTGRPPSGRPEPSAPGRSPAAPPSSPAGTLPGGAPAGRDPGPATAPRTPRPPAASDPAASPAPTSDSAASPAPTGDPAASPAPTGSPTAPPTSSPTGTPAGSPSSSPGVPWRRSEVEADRAYVAACVADDDSSLGNGGTRSGSWCLTAGVAETRRKMARLTFQACPAAPDTPPLTFADGRELDFVVRDGDRDVWSSATGRTFPATADPVTTRYGYCAQWTMTWARVGDDQRYVGPGEYTLVVTLRAAEGHGTDRAALTLAD